MAAYQHVTLPNELWIRVLQNLDNEEDICVLWSTCRHVCTAFRDIAESIFRERHLPKTRFSFNLGKLNDASNDRRLRDLTLTADYEFGGLSEDGRSASFRLEFDRPKELMMPTKERMEAYVEKLDISDPKHTIQIRRDVLDGPIPGLEYDKSNCELKCNWRDLFTAFYGEEFLVRRLTDAWLDSKGVYLEELKAKMARGEMGAERIISAAILEIGSGEETCRRNARRARIRNQYRELDGRSWDLERDGDSKKESDALAKLRILKQFASDEAFSDEEYSDEWEDESEEEEDESEEEDSTDEEL